MLHFDTRGQGPNTIVLLHGFLGAGRNLSSLGRRLSDADASRRVVMADLPGHGHSPPLGEAASLDGLADAVSELLAGLDGKKPIPVVGHSLGGRVLLRLLGRSPDVIGRAILLDIGPDTLPTLDGPMQRLFERLMGAPAGAKDRLEMRRFFVEGGVEPSLTDWILTNLEVEADRVKWRIDRAELARLHWQETGLSLWQGVERHGARIDLIAGERSHFVSGAVKKRLESFGVRTATLAGAGHFLHVEALDALVEHINDALWPGDPL